VTAARLSVPWDRAAVAAALTLEDRFCICNHGPSSAIVAVVLSLVKPHARGRQRHQLKHSRPFQPGLVAGSFEHIERELEFVAKEVYLELADFIVAQRFCQLRQIGSGIEHEPFGALPRLQNIVTRHERFRVLKKSAKCVLPIRECFQETSPS
jgi:hypothetical protein